MTILWFLDFSFFSLPWPLPSCISASRRAYVSYFGALERECWAWQVCWVRDVHIQTWILIMLLTRHRVKIRAITGFLLWCNTSVKTGIKLVTNSSIIFMLWPSYASHCIFKVKRGNIMVSATSNEAVAVVYDPCLIVQKWVWQYYISKYSNCRKHSRYRMHSTVHKEHINRDKEPCQLHEHYCILFETHHGKSCQNHE